MIEAVFFIPLARADVLRVGNTINSIRLFCENARIYLLLDGASQEALKPSFLGPDVVVIENAEPTQRHWGKIWAMQCWAMVNSLAAPDVSERTIFVKIDADAIIIRPGLVERAQRIFATRPAAGQLGQGFSNILGGRLANAGWGNFYQKMIGWRGLLRFAREGMLRGKLIDALRAHRQFRQLMNHASSNGYTAGEFAIGGSYILRREVVEYLARPGMLAESPFLWLPNTGEDGVMTPYIYAAGYSLMDDVSDDGIFAIEGKEIRCDPSVLKARGHYIIHPTKYGHEQDGIRMDEDQLVHSLLY